MTDRTRRIRPRREADSGSTKGGGFGSIVGDSAEDLSHRCRRCGHPITAEASLRWLLGCSLAEVERPELIGRMKRAGLTNSDIAKTSGVSEETVRTDLRDNPSSGVIPGTRTDSLGRERPTTYTRTSDGERVDTRTGELPTAVGSSGRWSA